jgi:hypothetical protein
MDVCAKTVLTEAGAAIAASAALMMVLRSIMVAPSFQHIKNSWIRASPPLNKPL